MLQRCCALLILCSFASACSSQTGPPTETVSGTVTLDGEPLKIGDIRFRPADGLSSGGAGKIEEGKYSFQTPSALMKVEIMGYREVPGKFTEPNPGEKVPVMEQVVPEKYNFKSELTADVKPGQTEFNFDLTSGK